MTASTHKKIRKSSRFWVTKINKKGKQPLVAPAVVEDGPVLMASTTVGTQTSSSDYLFYKSGYSKNTRMSFIIDTAKNPDNSTDNTIIVPFTLYTPSYPFTIDWGDGSSTTYPANAALTTVGLTHTYSNAGQYTIVVTSDKQKIPVLNWSTSGNVGGNKHKLIQLSTPLITFDTACPNSNSAQYFAYECDNLLFIATQFFINNPHIRNYDYCFSKCSKLVKIPYDLFKYVKYQSSYQEVFAHDTALQTVPNDLFATAKAIDLGGAFSGDSNLILDVDLDTFFGTEPYINVDVHDIFRDCVKTTGDAVEFTKKFTEYVAYVIGTGTFDTGWGTLTGKIYAQPIYNSDGKLVRDLVPAKTGNFYGGRIAPQDCLYDEVNGEFLLPSSTFTYGTEKDVRDSYVFEGKTGEVDYEVVGSPTIVGGVASGFDNNNRLQLNSTYSSTNTKNTKWHIRFKTPSTITPGFNPIIKQLSDVEGFVFGIYAYGNDVFTVRMGSQNGNALFFNDIYPNNGKVSPNTWYVCDVTGNNGIWKAEIFSDSGISLGSNIKDWSSYTVSVDYNIVVQPISSDGNYSGSIDLNKTYIKVNEKLWFGNQTQLVGCDENVYLQSDGNQYIDTGVTVDNTLSFDIMFKYKDLSSERYFMYNSDGWGNTMFSILWYPPYAQYYFYLQSSDYYMYSVLSDASQASDKIRLVSETDSVARSFQTYINGVLIKSDTHAEAVNFSQNNILIGNNGYLCYSAKLCKNGVFIRHFVPVSAGLQIGDFTVPSNGMWDIVNQRFYGNQGTGEFTIGGFNLDNIENNLPYSFKKNALYNCEQWSNFAIPESVWTGIPSSREDWLAVNEGKTNWLLTDSMNMLLLESANSNILCSPTDTLKADTESLLSWYTGTMPEHTQGIIKPEPYESVDSLRNIINALPELRGYTVVGNPTVVDGVVSGITDKLDFITVDTHSVSNTDVAELFLVLHNTTLYAGVFNISDFLNARVTLNNQYGILLINKNGTTISSIPRSEIEWRNATNLYINLQRSPLTDSVYNYTFKASLDGTNWVSKTVTDETNFFGSIIRFGCTNNSYGRGFQVQYALDLNKTYIKVNGKLWFDGTEKLNEVVDLSGCINKGGIASADLQKVTDKGYTLLLN